MKIIETEYDLNFDMEICSGRVLFRDDMLVIEHEGDTITEIEALKLSELEIKTYSGCGIMLAKMKDNGEDMTLCRFTMSGFKPGGEFCKAVNHYLQTGELHEIKRNRLCKKCGRKIYDEIGFCTYCLDTRSVLRRIWSEMSRYRKLLFVSCAFTSISSLLWLTCTVINRYLVDKYLTDMNGTIFQILMMAAAMLAARLVGELIYIVSSRYYNSATLGFCSDLRISLFKKIHDLPIGTVTKRATGDLIKRVQNDTETVKEFLSDMGRFSVEQVIMFVIAFVISLFTDWKMTLLVFLPMPFVAYAFSRFRRTMFIRYERQWRSMSKCQSILHDILKGIRIVKAFGNEDLEIEKFKGENKKFAEISMSNERLWSVLFPLISFFAGIGQYLVLLFGSYAILRGSFSLGAMMQFMIFVEFIYGPLRWLVSFPRWLAESLTSFVKIFEVLDEPNEMENENEKIVPVSGVITFDNVVFGYKSYEPVLKGISFEVKPNEMIGLVGKTGVGKSTIINLIMRLYDVNNGSIRIGDTDIRDISQKHLHENIGVVFQDNFLFAGTIYDNIVITKPEATIEEVIAASKAANAHDFIVKLPDSYNTLLGESGYDISSGERQRISIARAILRDPDILILDEATSSLDVETEKQIQDSLTSLTKGRTTIAIAHRLSTLQNADRLIVLDKGKIAEMGTHTELLKKKGIYYKLIMAQREIHAS